MRGKSTKAKDQSKKFPEYYKRLNPNWTDAQCAEAAKQFKKTTNWQCIEYWETKYPDLSHEEILELKQRKQNERKTNNPNYIEYYKKHYPELSNEEHLKMLDKYKKENCYQCEEYYIKRGLSVGEAKEERNKRVKSAGIKIGKKISGEGNGMHSCKRTKEQRLSNSPRNIMFYETRFPELTHEEHLQLQRDFFDLNAKAIKNAVKTTNIEYYLNQGLSYEDAYLKLKERQTTFSLEKCIEKYGEELGHQKFADRQKRWLESLYKGFQKNGDGRSKQSKFAKYLITEICDYLKIETPDKEKYIYDKEFKRAYAYDFIYKNKIIEFNGDYWHCNPKFYTGEFVNKNKNMLAKEIWEYDKIKTQTAMKYGYLVLTIWESDYNENKEEITKKCIEFINS